MIHRNKKKYTNKIFLISLAILVIVGLLIYFLVLNRSDESNKINDVNETINMSPPTEEEIKSADTIKDEAVKQQNIESSTQKLPNATTSVKPQITYAGQYGDQVEVGAFIGNIFEDGGKCLLTLSGPSGVKRAEVNSVKGASSVDCPVMSVKRTELTPGKWEATVEYSSNTASGLSDIRAFEVR